MSLYEEFNTRYIPSGKEQVYLEAARAVRKLAIVTGKRKYDKQAQRIITEMKKEFYKNENLCN